MPREGSAHKGLYPPKHSLSLLLFYDLVTLKTVCVNMNGNLHDILKFNIRIYKKKNSQPI